MLFVTIFRFRYVVWKPAQTSSSHLELSSSPHHGCSLPDGGFLVSNNGCRLFCLKNLSVSFNEPPWMDMFCALIWGITGLFVLCNEYLQSFIYCISRLTYILSKQLFENRHFSTPMTYLSAFDFESWLDRSQTYVLGQGCWDRPPRFGKMEYPTTRRKILLLQLTAISNEWSSKK